MIAVRGQRLALMRARFWGRDELPDAFNAEVLHMVEIDERQQIATFIGFDLDDLEAAIAELDARYVAGEAAPHARTWSVITHAYADMTRGELPATTPDLVNVDHRHVAPMAPDDGIAYLRASWDLAPDFNLYIESVHRLSDLGAVFTRASTATSRDGFDAEWRAIDVITVEGDRINRGEIFDEADLEAALARFDELSLPRPRPENAASRLITRFQEVFGTRDWDGMAEIFADDICLHDRRPVVGAYFFGRDATIANMRASADTGVKNVTSTVIATRGSRAALHRVLITAEINDLRPSARTPLSSLRSTARTGSSPSSMFDLDDIDAAFAGLDARYLAGEAADHSHTWSVIANARAALNRGELPSAATDLESVDHRRAVSFAAGEMAPYLRAAFDLEPDFRVYVEVVHRFDRFRSRLHPVRHRDFRTRI